MMKSLRLTKAVLVIAVALMSVMGLQDIKAQPDNYCIVDQPELGGYARYRCNPIYYPNQYSWYDYYYPNVIVHVKVYGQNKTPIDRESGDDFEGCHVETEVEGELALGGEYTVYAKVKNMYYSYRGTDYCQQYNYSWMRFTYRLFIDWNKDGIFDQDPEMGEWINDYRYDHPNRENNHPSNNYRYRYQPGGCGGYTEFEHNIKVPDDIEPGKTKMRVMHAYNYPYSYYQPWDACHNGYFDRWRNPPRYAYDYGESEDYILNLQLAFKESFPDDVPPRDILIAGEEYNGTTRMYEGEETEFPQPSVTFGAPQGEDVYLNYQIEGPLPSEEVVYEGLDPVTDSPNIGVGGTGEAYYEIQNARGPFAEDAGAFKATNGGEYRLVLTIQKEGNPPRSQAKIFTVMWDDDISVRDIESPKSNAPPRNFKYLAGQTIDFTAIIQNTGLNSVSEFNVTGAIYDSDGNRVYSDDYHWEADPGEELESKKKAIIDMDPFRLNEVGVYDVEVHCDLQSALDQEDYNDHMPRTGNTYKMEVSHEIQAMASAILEPENGDAIIANRPVNPIGEFKNVGVGDISDAPTTLVVKNSAGDEVYNNSQTLQDIPSGKYNTRRQQYAPMVLEEPGEYTAVLTVNAADDPVPEDNEVSISFMVEEGFSGEYTVGKLYEGQPRNFETIEEAMNQMYHQGISGPVEFILTDASYSLSSDAETDPAWNFGSKILGLGDVDEDGVRNTVTWRVSDTRQTQRASVTVNLNSATGRGVYFGQAMFTYNQYAPIKEAFGTPLVKEFINSAGYITFDGGPRKSLKMVLNTSSEHGSVFYFGPGAQNITVKNIIIENGTEAIANNIAVPQHKYSAATSQFIFDKDVVHLTEGGTRSYSSGIVLRNYLFIDDEGTIVDTDIIPNNNNVIEGNEISGFGYGVMSIGMGPQFNESNTDMVNYYNTNNLIAGNEIHDVARAGIYLGFENNSTVKGNRIYNVGNGSYAAAGILAGGMEEDDFAGYNNTNLVIDGNEISELKSPEILQGIAVQQNLIQYPDPMGNVFTYPNVAENTLIKNNIVWGFNPQDEYALRSGIDLYTKREPKEDIFEYMTTPAETEYFTEGDMIVNNTIVINNDRDMVNEVSFAGITSQHSDGVIIKNNAISIEDETYSDEIAVASALFVESTSYESGGFVSDYNAYWFGNTGATVMRFVEIDEESNILEAGERDEYTLLSQWRRWSGQDMNSIYGNFMEDMTYTTDIPAKLRVNTDPRPPLGSILNNRAENLKKVGTDIDGDLRGQAGQRYDIGAVEFDGRMFVSDVELLDIPTPGVYRDLEGQFSDAEYIMTNEPVEVEGRVRNNGALQQSGVEVTVRIYRETPDGTFGSTPELEETVEVSVAPYESAEVAFNLADGLGTDFNPQSYVDLGASYTVPKRFKSMEVNVTPRYMIEISSEEDQHNQNNVISKVVRFYIVRSSLSIMISGENTNVDLTDEMLTNDQVAGKLNYDSLEAGLLDIGWFTFIDSDGYHHIDVFDRNSWEPRAVDYTLYRTVFWADGDDKPLTKQQRIDINNFLASGVDFAKKNLLIGSQEIVRENEVENPEFVNDVFRAEDVFPGNPLGEDMSNDGNSVTGVSVGRNLTFEILSTQYEGDADPYCGLMGVVEEGVGKAQVAYDYDTVDEEAEGTAMGVAKVTLSNTVVTLGVDWRHWGEASEVIRTLVDYVENNGGRVIPVELADFFAKQRGKSVELTWATISENNSSHFEIEKAEKTEAGTSEFSRIAQVEAAGNSGYELNYGPVVDNEVEFGNSYVYRLKMIDRDGQFDYSGEKVVTLTSSEGAVTMEDVRPNPASTEATFDYQIGADMNINIELFDMSGKKIATVFNGFRNAGTYQQTVDLQDYANGTYTIVLTAGDAMLTQKVNIVR
jgi:hypothetical protein